MTTHRRKRLSALAAAAALPIVLLSACASGGGGGGGGGASEDEELTLTAFDYYTDEPSHTNMGDRLNACAADVNATVEHRSVPSNQYNQQVLQAIQSRDLPDILMVNNPDLPQFAETGALRPLTELDVDTSTYYESVLNVGRYEDELYGLAPNVNSLVLFYNEAMLAEAGIQPPTTWAELEAAAAALTTPDRYGFVYAGQAGTEGTWTFIPFLWSNGGSQLELDAPEAVEALEFYTGLALKGYVTTDVVNYTQADAKDQFAAGRAAMMINGPWQIPSLNETEGLEWASVPIPVPNAGDDVVAPLGGELWTVPITDDERERRAASIVECLNSPETQLETALTNNTVPSNEEVAQQLIEEQPEMESIVETVATAYPLTGDSGTKWPIVNEQISVALQSVITGQADPQTAMDSAQAAVSAE